MLIKISHIDNVHKFCHSLSAFLRKFREDAAAPTAGNFFQRGFDTTFAAYFRSLVEGELERIKKALGEEGLGCAPGAGELLQRIENYQKTNGLAFWRKPALRVGLVGLTTVAIFSPVLPLLDIAILVANTGIKAVISSNNPGQEILSALLARPSLFGIVLGCLVIGVPIATGLLFAVLAVFNLLARWALRKPDEFFSKSAWEFFLHKLLKGELTFKQLHKEPYSELEILAAKAHADLALRPASPIRPGYFTIACFAILAAEYSLFFSWLAWNLAISAQAESSAVVIMVCLAAIPFGIFFWLVYQLLEARRNDVADTRALEEQARREEYPEQGLERRTREVLPLTSNEERTS